MFLEVLLYLGYLSQTENSVGISSKTRARLSGQQNETILIKTLPKAIPIFLSNHHIRPTLLYPNRIDRRQGENSHGASLGSGLGLLGRLLGRLRLSSRSSGGLGGGGRGFGLGGFGGRVGSGGNSLCSENTSAMLHTRLPVHATIMHVERDGKPPLGTLHLCALSMKRGVRVELTRGVSSCFSRGVRHLGSLGGSRSSCFDGLASIRLQSSRHVTREAGMEFMTYQREQPPSWWPQQQRQQPGQQLRPWVPRQAYLQA